MGDENIFEYGSYKLYKDAFQENLTKNMDKYIREHNINNPQLQQDFRDAVDFISKGVGNYITHISGDGAFKDNKGYLKHDNLGHKYAANYINLIAHKQGKLGNAIPKKPEGEKIEEAPKKSLFDPTKNIIGIKFESDANPLGNDSSYSFWKEGTENPVEKLRTYIDTHKKELGNKYDFSGTNLTQDFYEKSLTSLYNSLADGVGDDDIKKMQLLGFKNPSAFKPIQDESAVQDNKTKQLIDSGWTIDPTTKTWIDPNGHNTQIPLAQIPEKNSVKIDQAQSINEQEEPQEEDTDWHSIIMPLVLDAYSIFSPEPISATTAGLMSDFMTYNDTQKTLGDKAMLGFNMIGSVAGAVPYIGDVFNVKKLLTKITNPKIRKGIFNMIKFVSPMVAVYGAEEVRENWDTWVESTKRLISGTEWDAEDVRNTAQLIISGIQIYRGQKKQKQKQSIKNQPSNPSTTSKNPKSYQDLRDAVKNKLQSDGKSTEEIEQIDALLRNLKKDDRGVLQKIGNTFSKKKYSSELEEAVKALINNGYSRSEATEMLLKMGFYKQGGIIKAFNGIKIKADDFNLGAYEGWDKFFNYNEANKEYYFKDGYDADALTKWGTSHGLNITLPTKTYGSTNYTYTPYNSLYAEGATSIGLRNSNNNLRSQSLKETPNITEEIDLNKHAESRRMYNTGDAEIDNRNRRNDFINFANYYASELSKGKDKVDLIDLLERYNNTVDAQYKFKQSDKGRTYTGHSSDANDSDVSLFNINNRDLYRSQNTELLHGYDDATQGKNGTATMGRSVDRSNVTLTFTEDDLKPFQDQPYFNRIKDVLLNNSFTNDGSGRYYVSSPLTISKNEEINPDKNSEGTKPGSENTDNKEGGVNGSDLQGNENSIEIAPTGEPMKKKKSVDFSPLISLGSYFESIKANKKILDLTNELSPLLYNPKEHKTYWENTLGKEAKKNATIAEGTSLAKRMTTSDQNFNAAFVRELYNDALKRVDQIDAEIDEINKQNIARATDTNNINIDNRWQTAMKNLENMHQVDTVKTQAKQQHVNSNYQSRKNLADEIKNYYNIEKTKQENINNSGYAFAVNQDIYKNPQNYMSGWNTYYDDIWKKGNSGKPLTKEEQEVYDQLQNKARNVLMANLYYNTFKIDNSINDISPSKASSGYDVVREILNVKKGGKLSKDDAKIILEFLKESNKNYNKAMDRSARSMYNYIKLQRKK